MWRIMSAVVEINIMVLVKSDRYVGTMETTIKCQIIHQMDNGGRWILTSGVNRMLPIGGWEFLGGEMSLVANGKNISTVCTEYLYIPTNMSICSVGLWNYIETIVSYIDSVIIWLQQLSPLFLHKILKQRCIQKLCSAFGNFWKNWYDEFKRYNIVFGDDSHEERPISQKTIRQHTEGH